MHVAGSYDPFTNQRRLYIDGEEVTPDPSRSSGADIAAPMNKSGPVLIGALLWNRSSYFEQSIGRIDDLKVWATIRSAEAICLDAGGTPTNNGCDLSAVRP